MNIFAEKNKRLILGRQGEKLVTTIKFPVSAWIAEFGNGTFSLLHQRSQDSAAYPVNVTVSNGEVIWTVSNSDVQYAGEGEAQLVLSVNNKVAKSEVFKTNTLRSLSATDNPPSAWQAWVDQVLAAGTAATTAVSHYPRINSTNSHWEVWSNGAWTDTGVLAKGPTPVITSSKTGNTTTVKADGTTIATLVDGTNGQDGHSPVITASKVDGVTTVSVDGSAVATIEDGTDAEVTHDNVVDAIGYTPVSDVKVNGTSIVTDGVAAVPKASRTDYGVAKVASSYGLNAFDDGTLYVQRGFESHIDARTNQYTPIVPYTLDYAVKSAITAPIGTAGVVDGVYQYPSYTAEEMASARKRIGIGDGELIADITLSEDASTTVINKDSNGNDIKLKEAVIFITATEGNDITWGSIDFYANGGQFYQYKGAKIYGFSSATEVRYSTSEFRCYSGVVTSYSCDGNNNPYGASYRRTSCCLSTEANIIEGFKIMSALKTGSNIKIYGVRA